MAVDMFALSRCFQFISNDPVHDPEQRSIFFDCLAQIAGTTRGAALLNTIIDQIDDIINNPSGKRIEIAFNTKGNLYARSSEKNDANVERPLSFPDRDMGFDFTSPNAPIPNKFGVVGRDGVFHRSSNAAIVGHELAHLVLGVGDGTFGGPKDWTLISASADFVGGAVPVENEIAAGLAMGGEEAQRATYVSWTLQAEFNNIIDDVKRFGGSSTSLTEGNTVDVVLFDNGNFVPGSASRSSTLDFSSLGSRTILAVGLGGEDKITGAGGTDYLYGGDGLC
jgi:hypothetical protein